MYMWVYFWSLFCFISILAYINCNSPKLETSAYFIKQHFIQWKTVKKNEIKKSRWLVHVPLWSLGHNVEGKKPATHKKKYILYNSIYLKFKNRQINGTFINMWDIFLLQWSMCGVVRPHGLELSDTVESGQREGQLVGIAWKLYLSWTVLRTRKELGLGGKPTR